MIVDLDYSPNEPTIAMMSSDADLDAQYAEEPGYGLYGILACGVALAALLVIGACKTHDVVEEN